MANQGSIHKKEIKQLSQEKKDALEMFYLNRAVQAGTYYFDADMRGTTVPYLEIPINNLSEDIAENEARAIVATLKKIGVDLEDKTNSLSGKIGIMTNYSLRDNRPILSVTIGGYDALQKMAEAGLELPAAEILGLEVKKSHVKSAKRGA